MASKPITKALIMILGLFLALNSKVDCQDFYQSYKSEFHDPYQKVIATPSKDDDKFFFQEQLNKINTYNPPSLQRFVAKQIITLSEADNETQKECIEAGLLLLRKNWIRGEEKIKLLKKIEKVVEAYQTAIKYDKKNEKLELYKTLYQIQLDIIDEYFSLFKSEEIRAYHFRWEKTVDYIRDPKLINSIDLETQRNKAKINNSRKLDKSLSNLRSSENSPTYKKSMAIESLLFLFSPESALSFLEGAKMENEVNMISAFSKFLNKQNKTAKAPYYFSERDLTLPPYILFERIAQLKELQPSAKYILEQFENGEYQVFHHARDIVREMINKYPEESTYDEKSLVKFFEWVDAIVRTETSESQLIFLYQLKPILTEAKAEIQDPQNLAALNKTEVSIANNIFRIEKELKLFKYRIPLPDAEEENEKEKQWLAKPPGERRWLIESVKEKIRKMNPNVERLNFDINPNSMTLTVEGHSQIENLSPLKELPIKYVYISHAGNINDFSFLKDSPVIAIDASWCQGIKTLAGLKGLKTLRTLNLSGSRLYDVSDLKGLNITNLNISHNPLKDLAPLKLMPLTELNIEKTSIISLAPLDSMPLNYLNANDCKLLKDIDALENTNLRILRLNGCELVSSLEPLSKLKLAELYIEGTLVSDVAPIAKSMLTHFYFSKCLKIRSILDISMMNIEHLGINNPGFISQVIQFKFPIKSLRLVNTSIQDLSILKELEQLETLDVSECPNLRDLRTLKNPSLTTLIANNCINMKSFHGIADTNIKNLYVDDSEVKDLLSLVGSKVEKLEIKNSELITLKGIGQTSVKELNVRDSRKLREINDLEYSVIEYYWQSGTTPRSFEPIKKIKNIKGTDYRPN